MMNSILQKLLNSVDEAYCSSKEERRLLHEIELSESNAAPSILGESEIRTDAIIGLARRYRKKAIYDGNENTLKILKKYGVYNSKILREWLLNEGENFRKFATYLHYLELLRLTLKEII